jgi:hypothetical protein
MRKIKYRLEELEQREEIITLLMQKNLISLQIMFSLTTGTVSLSISREFQEEVPLLKIVHHLKRNKISNTRLGNGTEMFHLLLSRMIYKKI